MTQDRNNVLYWHIHIYVHQQIPMSVYTLFWFRSAYLLLARSPCWWWFSGLYWRYTTLSMKKLLFCFYYYFIITTQQYMKNKGKSVFVTAEKKILIILLYYTFMTSTTLVPFAHFLITHQQTEKTLQNYFLCEGSRSKQPDLDCNVQELVATQLPGLHTVGSINSTVLVLQCQFSLTSHIYNHI